jgi:hypothetical protein
MKNLLQKTRIESNVNFDELIHDLRGSELERIGSKLKGTALHIGCAGSWYFEWVICRTPTIQRHIGVEFYLEKPLDLPRNVDWLKETAGAFPSVMANSVDWIFSGQNIEHLWIEDFVGFFIEASRVLKLGGRLTLDTPNSKITQAIGWNHSQHFAEFTLEEICELLILAGFKIDEKIGIFPSNLKKIEPVELLNLQAHSKKLKYYRKARKKPSESFIFWINATKKGEANRVKLEERATEIFCGALISRLNRIQDKNWKVLEVGQNGWNKISNMSQFPLRLSLPIYKDVEKLQISVKSQENLHNEDYSATCNGVKFDFRNVERNLLSADIQFNGSTLFDQVIFIDSTNMPIQSEIKIGLTLKKCTKNTLSDLCGFEI